MYVEAVRNASSGSQRIRRMDPAFSAAEERARLAAADLVVAATHVVALHTIRPEDVRDEVDAVVLSRRWTSYAASRTLDEARDDLAFAGNARDEIEVISASFTSVGAGPDEDEVATGSAVIRRLAVLAAECERRAALLRS
jgi:hypothetical protein